MGFLPWRHTHDPVQAPLPAAGGIVYGPGGAPETIQPIVPVGCTGTAGTLTSAQWDCWVAGPLASYSALQVQLAIGPRPGVDVYTDQQAQLAAVQAAADLQAPSQYASLADKPGFQNGYFLNGVWVPPEQSYQATFDQHQKFQTGGGEVGWFDSVVDAVTQVAEVVGPVVGAVQEVQGLFGGGGPAPVGAPLYAPGGNYGPAYQQGGYYAPPTGIPPAAMQYQNGLLQQQGYPPLPSYQNQYGYGGAQAGGFYDPVGYGGIAGGAVMAGGAAALQAWQTQPGSMVDTLTPDWLVNPVYGPGATPGTFFGRTTGGRPKTNNVIRVKDWNGEDRYWVGGIKLSKQWIKSKILSSQRKRHHHHHSKH